MQFRLKKRYNKHSVFFKEKGRVAMYDLSTSIPVGIHLTTHTVQDGQTSDYALDVEGQIVQIGETIYLRYQEPESDEQPSSVPVTIKFLPNGDVSLTRNGENRLRMHFSAGKRVRATYRTPYAWCQLKLWHLN